MREIGRKFIVFDPWSGTHTSYQNMLDAKLARKEIIDRQIMSLREAVSISVETQYESGHSVMRRDTSYRARKGPLLDGDEAVAYRFLKNKFGPDIDYDPHLHYRVFNIDKRKVIATVVLALDGQEFVKVANGKVTEHYRLTFSVDGVVAMGYSLDDMTVIETYRQAGDDLVCYNAQNDEVSRTTQVASLEQLPADFIERLAGVELPAGNISYWARKPYGDIIGIGVLK